MDVLHEWVSACISYFPIGVCGDLSQEGKVIFDILFSPLKNGFECSKTGFNSEECCIRRIYVCKMEEIAVSHREKEKEREIERKKRTLYTFYCL